MTIAALTSSFKAGTLLLIPLALGCSSASPWQNKFRSGTAKPPISQAQYIENAVRQNQSFMPDASTPEASEPSFNGRKVSSLNCSSGCCN